LTGAKTRSSQPVTWLVLVKQSNYNQVTTHKTTVAKSHQMYAKKNKPNKNNA